MADKGGAIVVMDYLAYHNEALRQLSDTSYYKQLKLDPTLRFKAEIDRFLEVSVTQGVITEKVAKELQVEEPIHQYLYLLPKIHKDPKNPPDIDECSANVSVCPSHASCVNKPGSFECNCNSGYEGDNCTDIDECGYTNKCNVNALCRNTDGSYECTCRTGYTGNGTYCTDIDECAAGNHLCPLSYQDCANSIGSFTCYCKSGYYLENDTCKDKNECDSETVCANKGEMCVNLEGSYECQCRHGYQKANSTCADVNECITPDLNNCSLTTAICSNYDGSYMCQCKAGYSGDGVNCTGMSCHARKNNNKNAYSSY
ncbi:adhesion G protein-coupled receptor E2-like [Protopterus annectens]|uniref:adhesion G protein-coupled receptor E2-like n=1 Tax=Protopterus annectens TaxID=7888 RepID=UPI001CFC3B95|nr:adhesion G protein-coupled receptor E2-like [Protopterus annectens]